MKFAVDGKTMAFNKVDAGKMFMTDSPGGEFREVARTAIIE